ncbi:SAM-dependent methyltransferase [Bacillus wiedmannii]|uniref:class I SAM-dependent methyltransferase n=1 Tax=Bacillus wiedmannii TaxID=1890302 RepID=UPI000BF02D21|nr:class I SAM-dependent methyltransferase [Bacillus wiedmannii]PEI34061.1 SAM-dependent methyltransferase [Bacillus wiedmannii]PEL98005.1 SAM-dependent methyltransferase [Bacillus wiedmannii]PEN99777.1 SAM-dependent methyltransferase [Bacillus wiedmannii]PFZ01245.1 SAM-dependent methyltransferase [Bacillus wiedmannii]
MKQEQMSNLNKKGWEHSAYQAWVNRHGIPKDFAKTITANPQKQISYYLQYTGNVEKKRIINLLGSKGSKAVAFALMGADVTVVDISESNAQYANELAYESGVNITYIVSDVLDLSIDIQGFDYVVLELGVLHYFVDLRPLFDTIYKLLKNGGMFILRDYHPVYSKLIQFQDGEMKANGNYFDNEIIEGEVAYTSLLSEDKTNSIPSVRIKRWTLGEIITTLVQSGLQVQSLTEESGPHQKWVFPQDAPTETEFKIPGLYTLIAIR